MPTTIQSVEIEWGDTDEWREVNDDWPEFLYYGTKVIYNITELDASKNIIITLSDADASGATLTLDLDALGKKIQCQHHHHIQLMDVQECRCISSITKKNYRNRRCIKSNYRFISRIIIRFSI